MFADIMSVLSARLPSKLVGGRRTDGRILAAIEETFKDWYSKQSTPNTRGQAAATAAAAAAAAPPQPGDAATQHPSTRSIQYNPNAPAWKEPVLRTHSIVVPKKGDK